MQYIFLSLLLLLSSCVSPPRNTPLELSSQLAAYESCFFLYNMKTNKMEQEYLTSTCDQREVAVQTFDIPLAVMAFDSRALASPESLLVWDHTPYTILNWDHDQSARTWMRDGVVWFSREITLALGERALASYLSSFAFGNASVDAGAREAWLTPAPFLPEVTSFDGKLSISPREQLAFNLKLWRKQLPARAEAQTMTQEILFEEWTPLGYLLSAKSGAGYQDETFKKRTGWYVAHLDKDGEEYLLVLFLKDRVAQDSLEFGSTVARRKAKEILTQLNLY